MAESFICSLQFWSAFARTTIKVLHLRQRVTPKQGARILQLCQGLQQLSLKIATNLPDHQNPLGGPLATLPLTLLSLDLASAFYGPMVSLTDLAVLNRIEHLHLTNSWVARRGLYVGLPKLSQLTHISFPVQPTQNGICTEIVAFMLSVFHQLRVVILWHMPYQDSQAIYDLLEERGLLDRRVVVFNAAWFECCAQSNSGIWGLGEMVLQWRSDRNHTGSLVSTICVLST